METVCVKLEEEFLHDVEKVMKKYRYATKTEFIREAVRDKIIDLEKREALLRLEKAYGAGAKKGRIITAEDIHKAGEVAFREIERGLGARL